VADRNTDELILHANNTQIKVKECSKKSMEQIYDNIMSQLPKEGKGKGQTKITYGGGKGQGKGDGSGQFDSHSYGDNDSQEGESGKDENGEQKNGFGDNVNEQSLEKAANDWTQQIAAAASATRNRGTLPGQLEQMIHDLLNPTIPWKNLLHRFMTNEVFADWTWKRPSRRSAAMGVYLPSGKKENLDVIVAIDTSGSVGDEELNEFMTEVCSIGQSFENVTMTAIICDAQVHGTFDLRGFDAKNASQHIKITGRGGTDHRPVAEWIKKNKPQAKVVVCFTDMATCFPEREDKVGRWIWVATPKYGTEDMCPEGDEFIKMRN
jgi:predicted metal-dependent peptidase